MNTDKLLYPIELIVENNNHNDNVLVLGNGFDIAHGLLTKYSDFVEFVKLVYKLSDELKSPKVTKKKIRELLNEEIYYKTKYKTVQREQIIDIIKQNRLFILNHINYNYLLKSWCNQFEEKQIGLEDYLESLLTNEKNISNTDILDNLYLCLIFANEFFLLYLLKIVMNVQISEYSHNNNSSFALLNIPPQIEKHCKDISKIVNFNFTNLYPLYNFSDTIKYYYINGNLQLGYTVFGLDEIYCKDNILSRFTKVELNKCYIKELHTVAPMINNQKLMLQKYPIYDIYKDLINKISKETIIYIFGHSLGRSDTTLIKSFLCNEFTKLNIYIYYTSNEATNIKQEFDKIVNRIKEILTQENKELYKNIETNECNKIRILPVEPTKFETKELSPEEGFKYLIQLNNQSKILCQYNKNTKSYFEKLDEQNYENQIEINQSILTIF